MIKQTQLLRATTIFNVKANRKILFASIVTEEMRTALDNGRYDDPTVAYLLKGTTSEYITYSPLMYPAGQFGNPSLFLRVDYFPQVCSVVLCCRFTDKPYRQIGRIALYGRDILAPGHGAPAANTLGNQLDITSATPEFIAYCAIIVSYFREFSTGLISVLSL